MVGFEPDMDTMPPPAKSSSSSIDLENPPPLRLGAVQQRQKEKSTSVAGKKPYCLTILLISVTLATLAGLIFIPFWIAELVAQPRYSVAIDSVSGLDPTTDLRLPVLDAAFNLTLRVASVSWQHNECLEPGTYVEVAYGCVTLATTATAQQRVCAGAREVADQQLVARGTGVRVPGAVLDSLAADMRQGQAVFQVTIWQSGGDYADDTWVASCEDRRVGAADDDLRTRCDAWYLCSDETSDGSD